MKQLMMSNLASAACTLVLAMPGAAADKPPVATHNAALRSAWPPENLSGALSMVDRKEDLVVVKRADGVPFDMTITPRTHIWSGNRKVSLEDLEQYRNKQVSIRFVPKRGGDVAESIRISG